ncbi:MAG: NADH-quinone oxidoreductase subunit J [Planctomycetota bacterium]|nr:NADH-quinone oxidoreductase subunit J [Planctomycetota bacterium]
MIDALFYLLAGLTVIGAIATVTVGNLLHAAIAFIGALLSTACLFLLMGNEFVALMQIMVYAGGVVIFVVYTILLTTRSGENMPRPPLPAVVTALVISVLSGAVLAWRGAAAAAAGDPSMPEKLGLGDIGRRLLAIDGGFLVPFELISLLLLAALVGATSVARNRAEHGDEPVTGEDAA